MKRKVKKLFSILLTMLLVFALVACGSSKDDDDDDRRKSKKKDKSKTEEVDEEYENDEYEEDASEDGDEDLEETSDNKTQDDFSEMPEESVNTVADVLFEVAYVDSMEYATITGVTQTGEAVWSYETSKYEVAQLDTLIPIGIYNDMYYYEEAGNIITIDIQNAEVIWKNSEFFGSCSGYDFDENGTLYLCGYFGPDLMVIDKEGRTLLRHAELESSDYYWPYELDYEQGYVFITYENNTGYYWEEKYFWGNDKKSQYGGYELSYCLADGSVGYEHNVLEPGFAYQGFYQKANGTGWPDEMQIDYLGENVYLLNINLVKEAYMANMIGYIENDTITFSDEFGGNTYSGILNRNEEGIVLIITESSNNAVAVGTEYLFVSELAESIPDAEELTSDELMAKIISVTATSSLAEKNTTHIPEFAIDGDLKTGWVEGASGQGIGETITITLDGEYRITRFMLHAGYQKSESLFEKNSRPEMLEVTFSNGRTETFFLDDFFGGQVCEFSEPAITSSISFTIKSVYPGSTYEDTVISEIKLFDK